MGRRLLIGVRYEGIAQVFSEFVKPLNYEVDIASNEGDVIRMVKTRAYDRYIFCDDIGERKVDDINLVSSLYETLADRLKAGLAKFMATSRDRFAVQELRVRGVPAEDISKFVDNFQEFFK